MMKLRYLILFCLLATLVACGSKMMSDQDYEQITAEFTVTIVTNLIETEDMQVGEKYEEYVMEVLQNTAQQHNYTAEDYLAKAEEKGEDWADIWERIEEGVFQQIEPLEEELEVVE